MKDRCDDRAERMPAIQRRRCTAQNCLDGTVAGAHDVARRQPGSPIAARKQVTEDYMDPSIPAHRFMVFSSSWPLAFR